MTEQPDDSDVDAAVDHASETDEVSGAPDVPANANAARPPVRLALIIGVALVLALGGLCGWLGYRAGQVGRIAQSHAQFVQVAKQGAINLTTIDHTHAEADVQRILDSSTGGFYDDFKGRSAPFVDVVKQAQSASVGTVSEAGLESATDQEGQVLVAVTVKTSTKGVADERPRYWRMRLTVVKQGEEAKVAKVDFVP